MIVGPKPHELRAVSEGAAYKLAMPQIREDIDQMNRAVKNRIFTKIRDLSLTPEVAYAAWLELYSNEKLLKNMETRVRVGESTGEEIAPLMKINPPLTGE